MKKTFTYIFVALSAIALTLSCSRRELTDEIDNYSDGFYLNIQCTESLTKGGQDSEKAGVDSLNENLINKVDYFLYPKGKTDSAAVVHGTVSGLNKTYSEVLQLSTNDGEIAKLFPGTNSTCVAFVVVNYPEDLSSETETTLAALKAKLVEAKWCDDDKNYVKPDNFVMVGEGTVNLISRKKVVAANGTINVNRLAAKVTMQVTVVDAVEVVKIESSETDSTYIVETWKPMINSYNDIKTYMVNAVSDAQLSGNPLESPTIFTYGQRPAIGTTEGTWNASGDVQNVTYYTYNPYYTYPNDWKYGDKDEPYFKIICPWTRTATKTLKYHRDNASKDWALSSESDNNTGTQKQFYYKIAAPSSEFEFNNWYHCKVNLAILGSDVDAQAVEVDYKYYVVDWSKEDLTFESYILDARYLNVEQDTIYLYNTNSAEISYKTSHPCEIVGEDGTTTIQHTHVDVTGSTIVRQKTEDINSRYTVSIDSLIRYNKELDNTITSSNFDYTVDTIRFTVRHIDRHEYSHNVVIIQYPAIYVDGHQSNGKVFVNEDYYFLYDSHKQYYQDHGQWKFNYYGVYNDNNGPLGAITDPDAVDGKADNTNQNLYQIHVSVLDDENLFIADPRIETGTTVSNINSSKITNYRKTDPNAGWAVAPAFMNASSYGKTTVVTYDRAVERCATYQEDGYPAGRWRLPTKGEIQFVVKLSVNGKIPSLFNSQYWCASGEYFSTEDSDFHTSNSSDTHFVRCVYDIWYWGDDPVESAMTTAKWSDNL